MAPIVVPCPDCAALNRLPAERVGDGPVCATCKAPLFAHPVTLDEASFDRVLAKSSLPVVVDFWAGWCGPCKQMEPHFAAAAQQLAGKVVFAKVDPRPRRDWRRATTCSRSRCSCASSAAPSRSGRRACSPRRRS